MLQCMHAVMKQVTIVEMPMPIEYIRECLNNSSVYSILLFPESLIFLNGLTVAGI